jgi:hypothetical protein
MEPWYKVAMPRKEVREGRSFNPDEFAIALEQVVSGTAPEDYRDPAQFFKSLLLIVGQSLGKFDKAIEAYQDALKLDSGFADVRLKLARQHNPDLQAWPRL